MRANRERKGWFLPTMSRAGAPSKASERGASPSAGSSDPSSLKRHSRQCTSACASSFGRSKLCSLPAVTSFFTTPPSFSSVWSPFLIVQKAGVVGDVVMNVFRGDDSERESEKERNGEGVMG